MKKVSRLMLSLLLLTGFLTVAQNQMEQKAADEFQDYAYHTAIETYKSLMAKGYSDEQVFKELGDAHYLNANYETAAKWYRRLFSLENFTTDADVIYRYAQSLRSNGEHDAAGVWIKKMEALDENDNRVRNFNERSDYLENIKNLSGRYTVENVPFNSAESDFAPSFYGHQVVFATARDTVSIIPKVNEWTNKPFLDIYTVIPRLNGRFSVPEQLSETVNKKTHESTTAFTKDGKTMYFTRNDSKKRKFSRDAQGVSRLKIYRAKLKNKQWTDITELPFNGDGYSVAHPALSPNERQLYFASDMKGSLGQSDIFVVDIHQDGSFGTPKNLGPKINTESRETFPFVSASNILYFASDGHPGLGGLDIFAATLYDMERLRAKNIGQPINGLNDDFSFIIDENTRQGFFASNRKGGKGGDDIYAFTEHKTVDLNCDPVPVEGTVTDAKTGETLSGAFVVLFDEKSNLIAEAFSGYNGGFKLVSPCQKEEYTLVVTKDAYDKMDVALAEMADGNTENIGVELSEIIPIPETGTDLISYLELKKIYFGLNEATIRPEAGEPLDKVVAFMNRYPEIRIQVQSHTDAKASARYNVKLSQKRADDTANYLIRNGIDPSRIEAIGFGKSRLVNTCFTAEDCSDQWHQKNRRSEIVVIE